MDKQKQLILKIARKTDEPIDNDLLDYGSGIKLKCWANKIPELVTPVGERNASMVYSVIMFTICLIQFRANNMGEALTFVNPST